MNVRVYVTPKKGILDPQGAAVERALPALGIQGVQDVRIGRFIELTLTMPPGSSREETDALVDDMCKRLLANPIIEDYSYVIDED